MDKVIIFITCATKKEAREISERLVQSRLVACVNIIDRIESIFWWKENIDSSREVLLIAKSKRSLINEIVSQVKLMHSYQVPEIIAVPIIAGNRDYIKWINESIR